MMLTGIIKAQLGRLGIDVKRMSPLSNFGLQIARVVAGLDIDIVFDIGGNIGQFGTELRAHGYGRRILSFEPLSEAHRRLTQAAGGDALWDVYPRTGLGATGGEAVINVAGNSASSSLLPMNDVHRVAAPSSAYVGTERVAITTLDAVAAGNQFARGFIKIDTQGFELEVLKGAKQTLARTAGLLIEMSLVELYAGQVMWTDLIDWLGTRGFRLHALNQGFIDPIDFRTLQLDGLFVRAGAG